MYTQSIHLSTRDNKKIQLKQAAEILFQKNPVSGTSNGYPLIWLKNKSVQDGGVFMASGAVSDFFDKILSIIRSIGSDHEHERKKTAEIGIPAVWTQKELFENELLIESVEKNAIYAGNFEDEKQHLIQGSFISRDEKKPMTRMKWPDIPEGQRRFRNNFTYTIVKPAGPLPLKAGVLTSKKLILSVRPSGDNDLSVCAYGTWKAEKNE